MSTRTLGELAEIVGGRLLRGDPNRTVRRVMPVEGALEDSVTFVTRQKYLPLLENTRAGAVMISPDFEGEKIASTTAVIAVRQPYVAFAKAAQTFAGAVPGPMSGVHASAVVDPSAEIGPRVAIGAFVVIGPGAVIGEGAILHPGVHIGAGARVGDGSVLYDHVVIRHGCTVGARCVLHPGVVIGADGFGFAQEVEDEEVRHLKIPQTGDVVIEDEVEIGANSCVDRGALGSTRIGTGTKIDNLVQIGHNVEVGPRCILVAQSGVAGSSRLGKAVTMGAQSGISGHVEVGEGVLVYGKAGVINDVPAGQKVSGAPAVAASEFFRNVVRIGKLDEFFSRLKKVEKLVGDKANGTRGAG
jgi:UDP-3-O-[3-hydroxymyristoyl] glucosamine N-acyltransferase